MGTGTSCTSVRGSAAMRVLIITTIASLLAALVTAAPGGAHGGIVLSGPSGVVTNHGAIGPAVLGLGAHSLHSGSYIGGPAGPSAYVGGPTGPTAYVGGAVGPSAYVGGPVGPSAYVGSPSFPAYAAGPAISHASVIGPAAGFGGHGLGLGAGIRGLGFGGYGGHAGYGGYRSSLGLVPGVAVTNGGGTVGVGHHGVTVKGPATVPATIAGPAGKVVANGLYGLPTHEHGW